MSESHRERQKRPSQTRVLATPTIALNLHPTTRQDSICVTAFPPYCSRDGCADKHNEDNELTLHRAALLLFTGKQATSVCTSCLTTAYSSIKTNTSNKNSLLIYHRGPQFMQENPFCYVSIQLCVASNELQPKWIYLLTAVAGRSQFNGWNHYLQSYHNWSLACQNLTLSALSITTVFPEISWLKSGLSSQLHDVHVPRSVSGSSARCSLQHIWLWNIALNTCQLQWYPSKCGR